MVERVLFITLTIMAVLSLLIVIMYFISNEKFSHVFNQKVVTKENKTFIIKVDYQYQKLIFTCRGVDKNNEPSIISKEYKFDQFIESLSIDQQIYLHEFLFKDCVEDNVKAKITINANKIFGENANYWLRLSYLERYANDVVYLKGVKIYKRNVVKDNNNFEYIGLQQFKERLHALHPTLEEPYGALLCISFNSMDFYQKRYGVEVANDYMTQMWDELNNIFLNRGIVGHLKGDVFVAYLNRKVTKKDLQFFIHSEIYKNDFSFGVDNSVRKVKPLIGAIIYGEYEKDIDTNLNHIYQIMRRIEDKTQRYRIYDDNLDKEMKSEIEYLEGLRKTLENQLFDPLYSPIISLNSGKTYGYFTDLDFSNYNFSSFNDVLNKTNSTSNNQYGNTFFSKAVSKWFSSFLNNADMDFQKLFVYTNFELIDSLINTYTSNEDYDKINLVAVITNYSDILADPETTRKKINDLKRNGIQLGIIASEDLQTVLSQELHQFTYLIIPRELTKDIVSNPRNHLVLQTIFDMTHDYYMDKIAVDIDNYQEAEVLKDMDVFYMSGNLFDTKKSNISMRRLTHLYDESNY